MGGTACEPNDVVVGIGELLWDRFRDARRPGGAPANVAWHASQLGLRGLVVSRLGRDEAGRALRSELEGRGLDLRHVQEDESLPTGVVDVDASDPNAPRYTIHGPAAWDALCFDADLRALAPVAVAVCYGTLFQRDVRSREALHAFLRAAGKAFRLYDVNLRQDFHDSVWIEASLVFAHAVKVNEDEARVLGRMLGVDGSETDALARHLRDARRPGLRPRRRGSDRRGTRLRGARGGRGGCGGRLQRGIPGGPPRGCLAGGDGRIRQRRGRARRRQVRRDALHGGGMPTTARPDPGT